MEKSKENDDEGVVVKKVNNPPKVDKPNPPENYTFLLGDL